MGNHWFNVVQLVDKGPVVVYFDASGKIFGAYAGGVYNGLDHNSQPECSPRVINHASECVMS